MRRFLFLLLIAAMAIGAPFASVTAADSSTAAKPFAVVSLAGYDTFKNDINYLGELADNPQLGTNLEGLLKIFTKNQGLAGLDKARPWGAVAQTLGDEVTGYAFLPVDDLKKLIDILDPFIDKPEEMGDGVYKIEGKDKKHNPPMFVKEGKGWIYLADDPQKLANVSDDPLSLLGGLEKEYQIAVQWNFVNVPDNLRQLFVAEMKKGAERDSGKRKNESAEEHAMRLKITGEILKQVESAIDELQTFTLGWNLDTKTEKCYLDASFVAKPGSKIANAMKSAGNSSSKFAGFNLSDAAIVGNWNGNLPAFKADMLKEIFDTAQKKALEDLAKKERDPAKAELGKQLIGKIMALLQDTLKNGRVDGGAAVIAKPDALTVVAGGAASNDGRIEDVAKIIVEAAKAEHPEKALEIDRWVKLNASEFQGVKLHTVSIPIPADAPDRAKMVPLIGETLEIVVGTTKDGAYIAAGRDPLATLKKAIEQSAAQASKNVLPFEISLSVSKAAEFIAAVGKHGEREQAAKLAAAFKQTTDGDHATLRAMPIDNGMKYRLEIETGVLKAIAKMQKDKLKQN
jgi:hypothetical protein